MEKKNNNANLLLSVAVTTVIIAIMMVTSSITNLKKVGQAETAQASNATISAPTIEVSSPIIENSKINSEDKKLSTVSLNPPVSRNTNAVNVVKQIKPLKLDASRTINLFGGIGENAHVAAGLIRGMNTKSKDPIYLILYSPGGSVVDGAALISAMQASEAPVYTVCYTFCASMAAMIHQYGAKRYITDRSILMFHPASFRTGGEVDKVASEVSMIQRYINKIEIEVATRMKMSFNKYKQLTANEYWIDSEDGLRANAADNIVYLIPTGLVHDLKSLFEDKKEFTHKKGLDNLQWIY